MAQAAGTRVALEFMPFTNVPNLEVGSELVNTTDHAFGGLMVDSWHLMRSGTSLSSLRDIPLCRIFGVELNDANLDFVGDLFEDTIMRRFPCGDGELDVKEFVGLCEPQGIGALGRRDHRRGVPSPTHRGIFPYAFLTSRRQFDSLE